MLVLMIGGRDMKDRSGFGARVTAHDPGYCSDIMNPGPVERVLAARHAR